MHQFTERYSFERLTIQRIRCATKTKLNDRQENDPRMPKRKYENRRKSTEQQNVPTTITAHKVYLLLWRVDFDREVSACKRNRSENHTEAMENVTFS